MDGVVSTVNLKQGPHRKIGQVCRHQEGVSDTGFIISAWDLLLQIVTFGESKRKFYHVHTFTGGGIYMLKSVFITVSVEIGSVTTQLELGEVADKRLLHLVTNMVF